MTQKLTVVYKAPPGDSKVTEAFGYTFHDGKPEEIEVDDETAERIKSNPMFGPGGKAAPPDPDAKHDKHK
jgi:hypothetical protein